MMTQAPLPTWKNLFHALLHRQPSDNELAKPWHEKGDTAGLLSRSAWSLALIALWRSSHVRETPINVWLPDFFCNAPLEILRRTDVETVFYPLTEKMEPDMAACRRLAESKPVDLFVLVHYFGKPAPAAAARDFCKQHSAWLIEDAAHVFRPVNGIGRYGDFVLYSLHKHLPIPDGALLVVRTGGPASFGGGEMKTFGLPDSWPGQLLKLQRELRRSGKRVRAHSIVWLFKRFLQKLGVRYTYRSSAGFKENSNHGHAVPKTFANPPMGLLARRLLAGLLPDLWVVSRRRQRNQMLWDFLLLDRDEKKFNEISAAERPQERRWTPYMAAYRLDPDTACAIFEQWRNRGLPASTWPDLPPEVIEQHERHAKAWELRHSHIYLPVHQSMSERSMIRLCGYECFPRENDMYLELVWEDATREQWKKWMTEAGRSNMLQSWAYGEAMSEHSGCQVRRGVFYRDDEPVAIVQMLKKTVTGLLSASRINRGPVPLRSITPLEQWGIFSELSRFGSVWRGRTLKIAPELDLSGSTLALMQKLGFRQYSQRAWESVWVDLKLEPEVLRKRLDGKWRNMLTFSEKKKMDLEISTSDSSFEWMMARYHQLMQEKDFEGPSIAFLQTLRKKLDADDQLIILRALHEGRPVAGICLARHGIAATYLLGWNGSEGRKLKANQYLLWQAIIHLKRTGFHWLDLGGINDVDTPGIASFKLGMNGERYELVGEYWKI